MHQAAEFFADQEMDLIYIAKRLRDAQNLESILDAAEMDYAIETDTYHGGVVFRGERVGAFFYVLPEQLQRAQAILTTNGYKPHKL